MSRCRACENEKARRYRQEHADRLREQARERMRQRRAVLATNPDQLAEYRERERTNSRNWRAKRGALPRYNARMEVPPGRVPVGPLLDWIDEQCRRDPDLTQVAIAAWLEVDSKQVRNWLDGHVTTVSLDVVDRAFCRLGMPEKLNEMWPIEDDDRMVAA